MPSAATQDISARDAKRRDFIVNGNLWKVVFIIAFPLFVYSIFTYVYSIIDTIMCSGISKTAVNAVSSLSQVTNLISALGSGIGAGGSILIAREIGRKDYTRAQKYASSVFSLTFLFALLTCAIIIPLSVPLLRACNVAEESIAIGKGYFMISVATSAVMMINTVYMGVEKAKGSTLAITLLNIGVVLGKIALNAVFLYGFQLKDMTFVSLSTLLANACLMIYIFIRLASRHYLFHYSFKNSDFSARTGGRIFSLSFPIFLGKAIFSLGKVLINGFAQELGTDVVGALGVSNNMGGSITNPLSSIEDSTSSIISQNLGANHLKRAIDTFWVGLVYSLGIAIIGVAIISIPQVDTAVCRFFARNAGTEQEISDYAQHIHEVFFYEKMGIITLALNSSVLGLLYGFGFTRLSMVINIARVFVFRIPSFLICQYAIPNLTGYQVAGISMGFSNIAIGVVAIIVCLVVISRMKKREKIKEDNQMLTSEEQQRIETYFSNYLQNYQNYKKSKNWCYEDGVVLLGAYRMYKSTRKDEYLDFCIRYFDANILADGSLTGYDPHNANTDDLQPGVALVMVNRIHPEEKYQKAIDLLATQIALAPRTQEGSFWHKKKYENQVWLDGLYMVEPFYALESIRQHSLRMKKDVLLQFRNVENHCKNPVDGLYYHGYDESKKMPWANPESGRSPNVWLRSVGWLAMAECDTCSFYEQAKAYFCAKRLKKLLGETLASLKPYEDPTTHMYKDLPTVSDPRNYLEASGSLMLAYSYMRAARENMIKYEGMKDGLTIFEGVVKHSFVDSHLKDIVAVSGLDAEKRNGSIDYYFSEPVVSDDAKGVGAFMMAYAEYLALSY